MPIPVSCPNCSARVNAPDSAAGKRAKCPKCGGVVPIPAGEPEVVEDDFEVVDEPPPRKKPRPVVDDEDDRPKKKVRRPVDDDEYDDRPRKKGKSKKPSGGPPPAALIGGGVVLLLLVGGGVYFALSGTKGTPAGGGPAAKAGINWVPFDAPDGSFAAAFPDGPPVPETLASLAREAGNKAATPEQVDQAAKMMQAMGLNMEGWSRTRGDRKFMVMTMTIPPAAAEQMTLDAMMKQGRQQPGVKVLSETDFTAGGLQGKELFGRNETTNKWTHSRIALVAGRLVTIIVQSDTELKADDADARPFFEKFQWKK